MTLPPPVERFRHAALSRAPGWIRTLRLDTRATMRRPGMPRIPLRIVMAHLLGHAFVHDIRIGMRTASVRFGLDAYVGDRGMMRIGPSLSRGPNFDQGALISMWGEALMFPWSWVDRPDVHWEARDAQTATFVVPFEDGEIRLAVEFDPGTAMPARIDADRYKADGPLTPWRATVSDWARHRSGVMVPRSMTAQWLDEPSPWIDIRTERLAVDEPVDDLLALGWRLLERARAA